MRALIFAICFAFIVVGCSADLASYVEPPKIEDGIETSTLTSAGFDSLKVLELSKKINDGTFPGVHGVLISRKGKLLYEEYFQGYDANTPHLFYSAGKIITSTIFGLAYDRGLLNPEDRLIKFYEPYYPSIQNSDKRKESIKFKNLLTMSTGIECGILGDNKTDINRKMIKSFRPVKLFLDQPMRTSPGESFDYTDANIQVIATAVATVIGNDYDQFEKNAFLEPLQISAENYHKGYLPRDFLKIGIMYQNNGMWNGRQILSRDWIEKATTFKIKPTVPEDIADGYGYYWWLKKFDYRGRKVDCYFAAGNGHQYLYVVPELELVVVFTGGNFESDFLHSQPHRMLQEYIINAMILKDSAATKILADIQ